NASEARPVLTGRVVDSYTNILTVKLFDHADREDESARWTLQNHLDRFQESQRNLTQVEFGLDAINGAPIVSATGLAIWLWTSGAVTIGAVALITALVIRLIGMSGWTLTTVASVFDAMGTVEEGMQTISRPIHVVDRPNAKPLVVTRGEIRYEDVSFHYGKEGGVIDRLSL